MRMRYKKHLTERMGAASDYLVPLQSLPSDVRLAEGMQAQLCFSEIFGNDNPVYLEIGCGKGSFALAYAKKHPDRNILAVEKISNVIVAALESAKEAEGETGHIANLRYLNCGAEYLPFYIPSGSIAGIYLNFSCPYPKNTYAHRRLTARRFLEDYTKMLVSGGTVTQKTDNAPFFDYSLQEYAAAGYTTLSVNYDLYAGDISDNIPTEYEKMFYTKTTIKKTVQRAPEGRQNASQVVEEYIKSHIMNTVRPPHGFLAKPFTVPCENGGFNNFYYWDTYFTNLALYFTGNEEQAKNNLDNFASCVRHFGYIPNADHLTDRSQPPLFARGVRDYLHYTGDAQGAKEYLPYVIKELSFWEENRKKPSGLYGWGGGEEGEGLKAFYLYVCERLGVTPKTAREELFDQAKGFMAIAESGWDFTFRFGRDFTAHEWAAVDLTALLADAWASVQEVAEAVGERELSQTAKEKKEQIIASLAKLKAPDGTYRDKREKDGVFSDLFTAASLYPYAFGVTENKKTADRIISRLVAPCGVATGEDRGEDQYLQWDFPMLWPPLSLFGYFAAKNTGNDQIAAEISNKFRKTVENCFLKTGKLWEKYNMKTGEPGGSVEYQTPDMLGWTAGVYLFFLKESKSRPKKQPGFRQVWEGPNPRKKPKKR
ncbi:MAG: tRNA (guanosine(46)-N7)-methyltransferase TrmB [Clostridia bacterium]|nr:tRNA (guanosine(46)-N7)-methyltransferase TrmB [Clostridia bacterium]